MTSVRTPFPGERMIRSPAGNERVFYGLLMLVERSRVVAHSGKPALRPALRLLSCLTPSILTLALFAPNSGKAQSSDGAPPAAEAHALFLSDIHFEPFRDPGKVPGLGAAPVEHWDEILSAVPSRDQQQRFDSLGEACHAKGSDTSYDLFRSSLHAMRANASDVALIVISGDLIAHQFSCKYKNLNPARSAEDYRRFVEKTIEFVLRSIRHEFPGVPVYAALGNNDSDCDDYRIDAGGDFLRHESVPFTSDFPEAARRGAEETFSEGGYYAVELPAPFAHTRLLVLDDLFMAHKYQSCSGKADADESGRAIAWLVRQLTESRRDHENVWVMGHIPPGINPVATVLKMRNVCAGQSPEMFLSSNALPDALEEFADVVRLAIFGHTHMDEMRLLPQKGASPDRGVPVKVIPSISPIYGNTPTFTVATLETGTARLEDYQVYAASNPTGVDTVWQQEYRYTQAYRRGSFSASEVSQLVARFHSDPEGETAESQRYLQSYFGSDHSHELRIFWPQYTCAFSNYTVEAYQTCVCANSKDVSPAP